MKKLVTLCLAALLMAGGLFASGSQDEAVPVDENGRTKVVFWTSHTMSDFDAMEKVVKDFNASQDEITVEIVQVVGSETDTTKLMTAVVGGVGPDVYLLDRFTVAQRASEGLLVDLTPYMEEEGDLGSNYVDYAWEEVNFQNHLYGLPYDTDARVVYYNKNLIREAGLNVAEWDAANGPMDIESFKKACFAMNKTDGTGAYTQIGFNPFIDQAWHYTWAFAFDADIYDASANRIIMADDPGMSEAFQFLYDWSKDMNPQKNVTWESTYFPPNTPPSNHPFITGKTAAVVTGDWFLRTLEDYGKDIDWGITYIPTPDKSKSSWSGGWSLVIPEGSKVVEAAYKFMRYFAGEEGQMIYVRDTHHLPTWKSLYDNESLYSANHTFFKNLLPYSNSRPAVPVGALLWDQLTVVQDKMELASEEPVKALVEAQELVNNRLKQIR